MGDIDPCHASAVTYARHLRDAAVACELHVEPGMYPAADEPLDGKDDDFRNTESGAREPLSGCPCAFLRIL
ncbi:hypothetical protein ACFWBB_11835 [Streptomyces sp. NPDC060000]|uniref:hypothetical protein n=1 Tax=Streptomyces sp. NPDC060000 TaxID=3347031 RepID=UPI0036A73D1A